MENWQSVLQNAEPPNREMLEAAQENALQKINRNMEKFHTLFPSACTQDGIYGFDENLEGWTTNFWTGQLWLAYEMTGDERYRQCAEAHMASFENRAVHKIGMGDHDIGFSFTLSTVAGYKITGNKKLRDISLLAAEQLLGRFREKGGFIQLGGDENSPPELYRLIVDCLMNIHLLFWAAEETGDRRFFHAAKTHFYTTLTHAIRPDGSAYQNVYFDPRTGAVIGKGTKQGTGNEACWSRGQAWVLYGLPLSYAHLHDAGITAVYEKAVNYFFQNCPADFVPYWDLIFTEKDKQPRDSSAAAIAVCGLLEAAKNMPKGDARAALWKCAADAVMVSLLRGYTSCDKPETEGLLLHGCYHVRANLGVDECMSWGDYFFMEALMRYRKPDWRIYW